MKLSIKWLSRYVDLSDLSPQEIRDALTMSTAEIEDVTTFAGGLEDFLVGEVLQTDKHPDADKLTLCKVAVGDAEPLSIVCGAPNDKKGQKVVVIQPGQVLPDGTRIKKAKIRGTSGTARRFGKASRERPRSCSRSSSGSTRWPGRRHRPR